MTLRRTPGERTYLVFRIVIVAALVAAFAQVTLGGVVRVTDSGLGCPDWPLCHGKIIPPFDINTLIEYSHRLSASALTALVVATVLLSWTFYRSTSTIFVPSVLALVLVITAALLGAATVLTELAWWVVLFHLGIAEVLVACLVIATVAVWLGSPKRSDRHLAEHRDHPQDYRFQWLVLTATAGVFVLILSGSYMVGYGAGTSCATWPLCRGSFMPDGTSYAIHMGHRYFAGLVGIIVLVTAVGAWKQMSERPEIGWAGVALMASFIAQVIVGAVVVIGGFAPEMKALHLSLATLVWLSATFLATFLFYPQLSQITFGKRMPAVSKLEGLTR